jgi:glycosyltransferase involved in cell wall biosynthesis
LFDNYGLPAGHNEALSALKLDPDHSYILFFGFVRAYKGLDLLIEAFSDARLRKRKLKLIVAGEFYDDSVPYMNLVNKYNLKDDIIFFDHFIKDSEVSLFFSSASLIVQPYRSATQSGVTQIAFHFEKPILVTDVGGLSEIVTDKRNGYVVKPEPESIADAILDYFESNRQSQFIEEVKKEKEKFSWDKMTAAIQDIYKSLIP